MIMSGDESPEKLYMWISPDPAAGEPDTINAFINSKNLNFSGGITYVWICGRQGADVQYDEITVGTTWDEVNVFKTVDGISKNSASALSLNCSPSLVSGSATINYHLATNQQVKVSLYNTLGNEVAVLLNANQAAGSQEVPFSAEGLSDGLYLCKLQAGNDVAVTQIIIKK
jgi:hypothetical protein